MPEQANQPDLFIAGVPRDEWDASPAKDIAIDQEVELPAGSDEPREFQQESSTSDDARDTERETEAESISPSDRGDEHNVPGLMNESVPSLANQDGPAWRMKAWPVWRTRVSPV